MSKSVNKVILLGNVGNVEIKSTSGGMLVANLSLATGYKFKDDRGNTQERTEWHHLSAFKRVAEIVRDYVHKGSKLYVEGSLQTRSWEDDETGKTMYRTEVIVWDLSLLSPNKDGDKNGERSASAGAKLASKELDREMGITDDDIPF